MDAVVTRSPAVPETPPVAPAERIVGWRPERCGRVALVLQGGGALGAYQAGVYEALHERGIEPDWVTGVSIGAINAALIAGNPRERRLERLRAFWDRITRNDLVPVPDGDVFRRGRNMISAMVTTLIGQPGFFDPRPVNPWLSPVGAAGSTSFYDSTPLARTLRELVDFDMINRRCCRFAVGAVDVASGNFRYFDNAEEEITPAHVMASGALPPALPMVKIGTDYWWDGGIVSNTPLQHLLSHDGTVNSLVFQVDLFSARGPLPRSMEEVLGRHKDIVYSSRTRYTTDLYAQIHGLKKEIHQALASLPESALTEAQKKRRDELADLPEILILQLIYQKRAYENHANDYEFSAASMREHWQSGYDDTKATLEKKGWLDMPPQGAGVVTHDIHRAED